MACPVGVVLAVSKCVVWLLVVASAPCCFHECVLISSVLLTRVWHAPGCLSLRTDDEFHVAVITPVIHYCMGGIAMNERAEVLTPANASIPGLYCAGEVMGGVHGSNRLGGSSLLDCVVYGRIAGTQSARLVAHRHCHKSPALCYPGTDSDVAMKLT